MTKEQYLSRASGWRLLNRRISRPKRNLNSWRKWSEKMSMLRAILQEINPQLEAQTQADRCLDILRKEQD
jgi:hypothetical protein